MRCPRCKKELGNKDCFLCYDGELPRSILEEAQKSLKYLESKPDIFGDIAAAFRGIGESLKQLTVANSALVALLHSKKYIDDTDLKQLGKLHAALLAYADQKQMKERECAKESDNGKSEQDQV
jgi:hypothetical protein